ncbi:MAG TPA: phosphonate ABC transporter, permease protein PhnE, partial [Desulfofustis sp.]|nr:phosphonate ABC transporter, permease protein PhnE [Desulfofustis sp.]
MSAGTDAAVIIDGPDTIFANLRARTLRSGIVLLAVLAYLSYTWVAFDMNGLIDSAKPERAVLLANDAVAHKVHVTKSMRTGETKVAIEGERTATYETPPSWVETGDDSTRVILGDGYEVVIFDNAIEMYVPDYGTITASIIDNRIETILPEGKAPPDWLRAVPSKFDARPDLRKRVQMSRAKIEVHRYFTGWENFFFPFNSPLSTYSFMEVVSLIFNDQRLDPEMANWRLVFDTFWENPDWQHGNVFVALLETLLMAVLGTVTAAFVA